MSNSYKGNSWFQVNKSPTAVIFVHGILSSCNSCWLNKSAGAYWPEIVSKDERMVSPSIFLGEYPSKIKSGEFDAYDAAELLYGYLKDEIDGVVPLDKEKLLFVCHSQGGIVVRRMLCTQRERFRDKKVGLFLCASPSWGSVYASILRPAIKLLGNSQAKALVYGAVELTYLDRDFSKLKKDNVIPDLCGINIVETKGLFGLPKIVSASSATRYFDDWKKVHDVNHLEIVKPRDSESYSHKLLRDFALDFEFVPKNSFPNKRALRFCDDLNVDSVSVTTILGDYRNGRKDFYIEWPTRTLQFIEQASCLLEQAKDHHKQGSLFHQVDAEIIKNFVEISSITLPLVERIRSKVEERIYPMLNGMDNYWGEIGRPQEEALGNLLKLANFNMLIEILYLFRFEILYKNYFPTEYTEWYERNPIGSQSLINPLNDLFEIDEPIYKVYVSKVGDIDVKGYYWGAKSEIMAAKEYSRKNEAIILTWYSRYLIPQIELNLVIAEKDMMLVYEETAILTKIRNEKGEKLY